MNGIVIVDKPEGWTSQDVAAKLRGVFQTRRIGHGGTLDPMATGVLPVFVGRATRCVEFFEHAEKTYETVLRPGITTDTEDITGNVLTEQDAFVTGDQLEQVLKEFRGEILQIPPMYSALKVNGQKLYELARKGKTVERQPRPVTIHELTLLSMEAEGIRLRVRCSKGTYIRTLCKDIGAALGCGGCMAALRRTASGSFSIENARRIADVTYEDGQTLLPVDTLFTAHPSLTLNAAQERRLRCGNTFKTDAEDGIRRFYAESGEFLALGRVETGLGSLIKSFYEVS